MYIYGNNAVIVANGYDQRGSSIGFGYVYTNTSRKWIDNGKIVP